MSHFRSLGSEVKGYLEVAALCGVRYLGEPLPCCVKTARGSARDGERVVRF
jgi:hypothetical protein